MDERTVTDASTFVVADGEVGLPSSLWGQTEDEAVSSDWFVGICGADGLNPLEERRKRPTSNKL